MPLNDILNDILRKLKKALDLFSTAHTNLVHILGHGILRESEAMIYIDMEPYYFSLHNYINTPNDCHRLFDSGPPLPDRDTNQVWHIMKQLSLGIDYIHNKEIVHGSITSKNSNLVSTRQLIFSILFVWKPIVENHL